MFISKQKGQICSIALTDLKGALRQLTDWLSSLWAVVIWTVLLTALVFILDSRTQDFAGRGIGWFSVYVLVKGTSHASTSSGETLSLESVPPASSARPPQMPYGGGWAGSDSQRHVRRPLPY